MNCPDCDTELEKVEGETEPARQEAGEIIDSKFGEWLECPKCGYQTDIEV